MTDFATLAAALPFNFTFNFILMVEGIPDLLGETGVDWTAPLPTGYGVLDPSLIVDESAAFGSQADRRRGIGRAFDLIVHLRDTAITQKYFKTPTVLTRLSADLSHTETTALYTTDAVDGFTIPGPAHIGREAIPFSATLAAPGLATLTRGQYGKAYKHSAGVYVTDAPITWRNRKVILYAIAVDPGGQPVYTTTLLDQAAEVWSGHVSEKPRRDRGRWLVECRSIDRELDRPVVHAASGKAEWSLYDDQLVTVDPEVALEVRIWEDSYNSPFETQVFRPFSAYTSGDQARLSTLRAAVVDAWAALSLDVLTGDALWERQPNPEPGGRGRLYTLAFLTDSSGALSYHRARVRLVSGSAPYVRPGPGNGGQPQYDIGGTVITSSGFGFVAGIASASLKVQLDEGDPARLPSPGWIRLETDAQTDTYRYSDLVDAGDGTIDVLLEGNATPNIDALAIDESIDDIKEITATFIFRATGTFASVMLQLLMSSGRGDQGAYDVLPKGSGYDIADVDTDSFDEILDGEFRGLSLDMALDSKASFADLFGELLALSERAIVPVETAAGMVLKMVRTGAPDTGQYAWTLTDADLVVDSQNEPPVQARRQFITPTAIDLQAKSVGSQAAGRVRIDDEDGAQDYGGEEIRVEVHGIARDTIAELAAVWGISTFARGRVAQIIEASVVPWLPIQPGSVGYVNISSEDVWQWSTGTAGYVGAARCLGRRLPPQSGVQKVVLHIDGILQSKPMSPAFNVLFLSTTDPALNTFFDVAAEHLELLESFLEGESSFRMAYYMPGEDGGLDYFDFDDVAIVSGYCRLTVSDRDVTSATIDIASRLTLPPSDQCNAEQLKYLHTDDDVVWS